MNVLQATRPISLKLHTSFYSCTNLIISSLGTHVLTRARAHAYIHTCSRARARTHTHMCARTHTHIHTHIYTHTHTQCGLCKHKVSLTLQSYQFFGEARMKRVHVLNNIDYKTVNLNLMEFNSTRLAYQIAQACYQMSSIISLSRTG